jgi:D-3-phosphoglycerate dehydrogenase
MKVFVSTAPFAELDRRPIELLEEAGITYELNSLGRKLSENELEEKIAGVDALIAGTELISKRVLNRADSLKLISRVGIGLDSVDLWAARERGVAVSYTPDAPSPAVAELTIGLMLSLLRGVHLSNHELHQGKWRRIFGARLSQVTVGLIGVGRIGRRVVDHLRGFGPPRIVAYDIDETCFIGVSDVVQRVDKDQLLQEADLISLHVPLTIKTRGMIAAHQFELMKRDAFLINTARGGIVDEADLHRVLSSGRIAGAAIDVFVQEPYSGPLNKCPNVLLTGHMGSMTTDCRAAMELQATEEVVRLATGQRLANSVPEAEYDL